MNLIMFDTPYTYHEPLASTKNINGEGKPGTDLHVILRHNVTTIITKIVTQLCSHVIGQLEHFVFFWMHFRLILLAKGSTCMCWFGQGFSLDWCGGGRYLATRQSSTWKLEETLLH